MSALYPTTLCSALPRVVEAPYPTTLCNVLPRVVEAPTPTKHTSPRPMLLMIQRPAAGGASPSPTIYVSFASRLHVIATKRAVRRTRVFKRRTLQHSVTPCRAHILSTGAPYDPTPCRGRSKPLPYNKFRLLRVCTSLQPNVRYVEHACSSAVPYNTL